MIKLFLILVLIIISCGGCISVNSKKNTFDYEDLETVTEALSNTSENL